MEQAIFIFFALFFLYFLWSLTLKKKLSEIKREGPCCPGYLPIIGHLHKLRSNQPLAITLSAMADKTGPVFTFWVGRQRVVVVSSWDIVKECFTSQDKFLAGRMETTALEHLTYDYAVLGFASYGDYWRGVKKFVNLELLSPRRLDLMKDLRSNEIDFFIKHLYRRWARNGGEKAVKVEMGEWFGNLTFNNMMMSIAGKRYFGADNIEDEENGKEFRKAAHKVLKLVMKFVVSDAVPWLQWADIGGHITEMKKTAAKVDEFLSTLMQEHQLKRQHANHVDEDFADVLLSNIQNLPPNYSPDITAKATLLNMILAGDETVSLTMTWVLALLMNNRHVLRRAQQELDEKIGKERNVDESDIENLSYIQAVTKESMRLYPPGPLIVPHKVMEGCQIGGYHVPAGTILIANALKIHRDPTLWPDPDEFRPERFLTSDGDYDAKEKTAGFMPFGIGRRACPGVGFGLRIVHLTLARLLHGFDLDTAGGCPVDMSVGPGLEMAKVTPLEVFCSPRISSALFM